MKTVLRFLTENHWGVNYNEYQTVLTIWNMWHGELILLCMKKSTEKDARIPVICKESYCSKVGNDQLPSGYSFLFSGNRIKINYLKIYHAGSTYN